MCLQTVESLALFTGGEATQQQHCITLFIVLPNSAESKERGLMSRNKNALEVELLSIRGPVFYPQNRKGLYGSNKVECLAIETKLSG